MLGWVPYSGKERLCDPAANQCPLCGSVSFSSLQMGCGGAHSQQQVACGGNVHKVVTQTYVITEHQWRELLLICLR